MLCSACAGHREPASQSQKTPAAEPAQERLATCRFTVYCVEGPSRAALPGSASGPAAGNQIWVQRSRGVVKAAGDAGLAGLWSLDWPACSG